MAGTIRILGLAGSLRKNSYNRSALRAAQELVPEEAVLETHELDGIPPYNQDLENPAPEAVQRLKAKVRAADAILFVTPEYNYSVSGVLKNAIDWASRPYGDNPWDGKPCAIMGASVGMLGTARAQYHLRQMCVFLNMFPLNRPEVMIANAAEKFDAQGNLTDAKTRQKIQEQLRALASWIARLTPNGANLTPESSGGRRL
jgi:chromate reductase